MKMDTLGSVLRLVSFVSSQSKSFVSSAIQKERQSKNINLLLKLIFEKSLFSELSS